MRSEAAKSGVESGARTVGLHATEGWTEATPTVLPCRMMDYFLDEADEGACFGGRRPASREHRPKIDVRQFPITEDRLDSAVR
jgi:hypothetical protein